MSERPLPSLIDRLIDDAPDDRTEPPADEWAAVRQIKLGLRRDLEGLLNAKRPFSRWLTQRGGLEASIVGFGLPDLSTEDFATPAVRERIRRMLEGAIRCFEPRLRRVQVETDGGPTSTGVHFRITALLVLDYGEEQVSYDAKLRPSDREFAVRLSG